MRRHINNCFYLVERMLNRRHMSNHPSSELHQKLAIIYPQMTHFSPGVAMIRKEHNKIASEMPVPHSLRKIVFHTMRYKSSEKVQRFGYFKDSVSYIKLQIMFK